MSGIGGIDYPGWEATGMSRKQFEKEAKPMELEAQSRSNDYLIAYLEGYEENLGIFGRIMRRIDEHSEPYRVRAYKNEVFLRNERRFYLPDEDCD